MAAKNQTQDPKSEPETQPETQGSAQAQGEAGGRDYVELLLDTAYALAEERSNIYTKQGRVRTALRAMRDAGALNKAQADEVEAVYPTQAPRKGKGKNDESEAA